MNYKSFKDIVIDLLNKHASIKEKTIRGNNAPFMNRVLPHNFIHRSKLKNKFNNNPTNKNKVSYKKHRNYCVKLLGSEKKNIIIPLI